LILALSMVVLASTSTQVGQLPVSKRALMSYPKPPPDPPGRAVVSPLVRRLIEGPHNRPIGDFWDFSKPLD
jgi:hypothetical protein